ncbi:MAG: CHAD domain-containing protein [Pseudorhodoplanes sp.]
MAPSRHQRTADPKAEQKSPPSLQPNCHFGRTLRAIALYMIENLKGLAENDALDGTQAVHDVRRLMKRWRSLLRLLAPFLEGPSEKLREDARALARRLSVARDAQAAIDALHDALEAPKARAASISPRTLETLRTRLQGRRSSQETVGWSKAVRRDLSNYATAAAYQVAHWPLDAVGFDDLAERLARTYRRARRAIPEDWDSVHAEELHALRRRVIEIRYQLELVEPAWPRFGRMWVEEAQRLRTRLGSYQDLEMLRALTAPRQPLAPWRSRLLPIVAARQAEHAKAAARIAARLFAEPPKAFQRRIEAIWEGQEK